MEQQKKRTTKNDLSSVLSVLLLGLGIAVAIGLDPEDVARVDRALGVWGLLLVGLLILASQVVAPLSGMPGLLIAIRVYGSVRTFLMFYVVCMTSAAINFWIARTYGRWLVSKLAGGRLMREIDELALASDRQLLIGARLLCFHLFDTISYVIGLTTIPFRTYYVWTAVCTLPPIVIQLAILQYFDVSSFWGIAFYYASFLASGLLLAYFFRRFYVKRKSDDSDARRQ